MEVLSELLTPINIVLTGVILFLTWKLFGPKRGPGSAGNEHNRVKVLPKMKRRDFTLEELREYSGAEDKHEGRILIAVNGTVFDVTRGSHFYGPSGPYHAMAGRDASRMLATFNLNMPDESKPLEHDDLSDLTSSEMDQVKEWFHQFQEKYDVIGKLLKSGEEPTDYEEENDESAEGSAGVGTSPVSSSSTTTTQPESDPLKSQ